MEPNGEMSLPSDAVGPATHSGNCSQTEIKVERVTHSWTVKNFSHCYQEYLENFVYLHRNEETFTWSIKIYPKGNGENNKDFVFLCLNKVTASGGKASKIGFKSRFLLKSAENKDIEMRIHPNPSHSDYVSYIKRDVLFPQIQPKDMVCEEMGCNFFLQIIVLVEIDVAVETVTVNLDDQIQAINCEQQLLEDYQRILRENILTDFTIRVGERELRCHRAILAARSPVFAAMFMHSDTNEAKTGVLTIEDLDMEVVKELVNYIYAGRFSKDVGEKAGDLLIAADKYGLEQLKTFCENILIEALNLENSCQLLILAEIYNAKMLKTRALRFITQHSKAITNTTGWAELLKQYSHLVTEVVRNFDKSDAQMLMAPISTGLPPGSV